MPECLRRRATHDQLRVRPAPRRGPRHHQQSASAGAVALGPHGPELLTCELVRNILRDQRFRVPQGLFLAAQGITSGPLWDRVATNLISLDGAEHHRLRRLVSKAFTPRATGRLRATIVDVITELVDRYSAHGRCDVVTDIAREYPIPIICAPRRAARGLGAVLGLDRGHL
jgi:cytochrome P450